MLTPFRRKLLYILPITISPKGLGRLVEAHSQSLLNTIHFGLGDETEIDSISVRWRNGETYIMKDLSAVNTLYDTDNVAPTSITVDPSSTDVREGTSLQLTAEVGSINANMEVVWASSNAAAVSVDAQWPRNWKYFW